MEISQIERKLPHKYGPTYSQADGWIRSAEERCKTTLVLSRRLEGSTSLGLSVFQLTVISEMAIQKDRLTCTVSLATACKT